MSLFNIHTIPLPLFGIDGNLPPGMKHDWSNHGNSMTHARNLVHIIVNQCLAFTWIGTFVQEWFHDSSPPLE